MTAAPAKCICYGKGWYRSPRCIDRICAHRLEPPILGYSKTGKPNAWGKKMSCPQRACPCPLGDRIRLRLARKARID